jgi:hypothetical protein
MKAARLCDDPSTMPAIRLLLGKQMVRANASTYC